ncbi:uncharacterized protein LOC118801525 [Colossoma macropomum]|uniref:uncharacterized protein LOC118801525 n=1 Tax=Colossoma macropomum TaxID=42526 RepID=UPI001864E6A3|nr:uncharacterized protein LOC118801525 [Colossoma macropomum]
MPRSKEISEDLRKKVVEAHQSGKGYKLISKALGLPKTTVRSILCKWKRFGTVGNRPRSGRPPKISPGTRRDIIREVMKNPCTTSKDLQATLASANIRVHDSTIRRILGIHGRPTLSGLEDSMELKASSEEEGGIQETSEKLSDISDEFNRDVKVEEDQNDSEYDPVVVPNDEEENLDEGEAAGQDGEDYRGGGGAGDDNNEKRTESGDDTDSDWW